VVHLSCGSYFLSDHQHQVTLAQINLEAAKYCREIYAFEQAVSKALQTGLEVLLRPTEKWSDEHFDLTSEIVETQTRMQLVVGDFEACKATAQEASRYFKTSESQMACN
jgi:hypothetical protein